MKILILIVFLSLILCQNNENMCKTNKVYNQKTKRCDMMCEEELIYNINKDICKCEIGKYYIEETSKCYLMCKKKEKYIKETN